MPCNLKMKGNITKSLEMEGKTLDLEGNTTNSFIFFIYTKNFIFFLTNQKNWLNLNRKMSSSILSTGFIYCDCGKKAKLLCSWTIVNWVRVEGFMVVKIGRWVLILLLLLLMPLLLLLVGCLLSQVFFSLDAERR